LLSVTLLLPRYSRSAVSGVRLEGADEAALALSIDD
jgi:hypothetical protein